MKFDSEDENFKTWLQEPTPIVWLHLTLSVTSIKAPDTSGMDALFPKPGVPVMLGRPTSRAQMPKGLKLADGPERMAHKLAELYLRLDWEADLAHKALTETATTS